MNDKTSSAASAGGEFLSFTLGAEHYGVDILKVQEIRGRDQPARHHRAGHRPAPETAPGQRPLRRLHRDDRAERGRPRGRHRGGQRLGRDPAVGRADPPDPGVRRRRRYPLHLRHRYPR
ncbi:hypothetical protein G6F57_016447 [Rhizopus arrhizus]|nr:hypothetical protein G6F59_016182 [Rhizopus arrhizus]KAG1450251.1 hypothetical protein G6F57_016447 [Rhizopus arrhizus]